MLQRNAQLRSSGTAYKSLAVNYHHHVTSHAIRISPSHGSWELSSTRLVPSRRALSASAGAQQVTWPCKDVTEIPLQDQGACTVVWVKNDVRIDDHPGLVYASRCGSTSLLAVHVIDPAELQPLLFTTGGPEVLVASLTRTRAELRARGSDLLVRVGAWSEVLPPLLASVNATALVVQEEVEHRYSTSAGAVLTAAAASGVSCYRWSPRVWHADDFHPNYRVWAQNRGPASAPLDPPSAVPPPPSGVDPGVIPSAEELRKLLLSQFLMAAGDDSVAQVGKEVVASTAKGAEPPSVTRIATAEEGLLPLLRAFLRCSFSPPVGESSWIAPATAAATSIAAPRASFPALFGALLAVGALSRRRVRWEADKAKAEALASRPAFFTTVATPEADAASDGIEGADFHWHLAARNENRGIGPEVGSAHYWRWRGALADYCVAEPASPLPGAPAVVLVHGFGAFGDHYRYNIADLTAAGYRVFAPTYPGFGRSEKTCMAYTQDVWKDYLRDFILQVVRAPAVVAGNSIGGFISASLAGDYPSLVAGLVLVNSAGPINPAFTPETWALAAAAKKPPPDWVARLTTLGLFAYLENSISKQLKWLYTTHPERADEWLAEEIFRAACDLGSLDVFKAVFYLPPPRALNYLVSQLYRGPVLVLQGMLDPLNDSRGRAAQLDSLCDNAEVAPLEAGHCPHDEAPEDFNRELIAFLQGRVAASWKNAKAADTLAKTLNHEKLVAQT